MGLLENTEEKLVRNGGVPRAAAEIEKKGAFGLQHSRNFAGPLDAPGQIFVLAPAVEVGGVILAQIIRWRCDHDIYAGRFQAAHPCEAIADFYDGLGSGHTQVSLSVYWAIQLFSEQATENSAHAALVSPGACRALPTNARNVLSGEFNLARFLVCLAL